MLSRVADSLYWMSRYLERAEHTARLLDLTLNQALDQSPDVARQRWRLVLTSLRLPVLETLEAYPVTQYLTFGARNKDSLISCINVARENARQIREQISSEMWEQLNQLYLDTRRADIASIYAQPHGFYGPIKQASHLFQGITDSTLMRNEGWHFIQLGRYIERASATATLLDVHLHSLMTKPGQSAYGQDYISWVALLKSCTSFEAYCQTYTADLRPERIAEFLLLNSELPRSVRFAVDAMQASLEALAKLSGANKTGRSQRLAGKLRAKLDYAQVDEIIADDIHSFLQSIQRQCAMIHTAIQQQYIAYSVDSALAI
ncbi:MAG TPA: alpha-E domain-containing protein [Blastocatellia bacterium]|nr:alpha-E domain-containing protein [Blastocatellia bacterium]HMV82670.1 alpha-E domain-containing protein [Blastocatellia bacterium]HMZ16813.1 alpha-E domain-containing protein [Blastocatellia bacterium]HNG32283.1 alpha-E domain-containing protein [Blastocatellia bacterium]